jgi:hypothetical protein
MVSREDFRVAFNEWLSREVQTRHGWSGKAIAQAMANSLPKVVPDRAHERVWVGIEFTDSVLLYLDNEFGKTKRTLAELNRGLPAELRARHVPKSKTIF